MSIRNKMVRGAVALTLVSSLALAGCGSKAGSTSSTGSADASSTASTAPIKIVYGVTGGACEAPVFAAKEKGFFEQNGLDVDVQILGFDELKTGLATGKVDATVGNLEWIKPIEEGMDIRFVQGIHRGCIRGVGKKGLNIKSAADLKGKRLGVNGIADYPDVLAESAIAAAGLDPKKDVEIKAYPGPELPLALKKGEIDAFIMWDPIPTQYLAENSGATVWFDNMVTEPFNQNYCCMLTVSGKFADENPAALAKLSKAITEASLWVGKHPQETAKIEVEKKYVSGDEAQIAERLASYGWDPSVEEGKKSTLILAQQLQKIGLLNEGTDPQALVDRIYVTLPAN
jgi:NitT/TauT family transport system substrate-binding protein